MPCQTKGLQTRRFDQIFDKLAVHKSIVRSLRCFSANLKPMRTRFAEKCVSLAIPFQQPRPCKCKSFKSSPPAFSLPFRALSISRRNQYEHEADHRERPRWQATPPRMTAPFRSKPHVQNAFVINDDPNCLDDVYINMLGTNGDRLLTEEVKWLAVTHKSFDHGRRGFNERLAFLGMLYSYFTR